METRPQTAVTKQLAVIRKQLAASTRLLLQRKAAIEHLQRDFVKASAVKVGHRLLSTRYLALAFVLTLTLAHTLNTRTQQSHSHSHSTLALAFARTQSHRI